MATSTKKRDLAPTLAASKRWIADCLVNDGSVFGKSQLWTPALIQEAKRAFVDHPDAGKDDFLTKLRGQMRNASPAASRLMAEMMWALLLFPSNISPETKRSQIKEVWAQSGEDPPADDSDLLSDAVLTGIGSGGPGFNNHRWRELAFLIAVSGELKKFEKPRRDGVLTDYDSFLKWIDTVPRQGHRQFRHMFRYFLFPERVERMSSNGDRRKVLEAFGVAPVRETKKWSDGDLDDAILKLRKRFEAEHAGEALDFYEPPLVSRWKTKDVEPDDPEDVADGIRVSDQTGLYDVTGTLYASASEAPYVLLPVLKILYGPPGTGKTRKAAMEAVRAVDPNAYEVALEGVAPEVGVNRLHNEMVKDGRIVWVTFHPSYSYEDFVEGYRPITDDRGQLGYQVIDGPFKLLCKRAKNESDLQIGEQLHDASGNPAGTVVDKDPGGWMIHVTPGRSDEVAPEQQKYVSRLILHRFMEAKLPPEVFSIPGKAVKKLSEYGINPDDADVPPPKAEENETKAARTGSTIRRIVAARARVSSSDLANASHYGAVYRRLIEKKSGSGPQRVALVIDEINRADVSRVLGELLTLLEFDKRDGMTEARQIWLPYSKTLFSVPLTVSVIGTMNTVDRSLSALDYAMRRRFEFELVDAEPDLCPANYGGIDIRLVLRTINQRIDVLLGKDYRIGHAVLMRPALEAVSSRFTWSSSPDGPIRSLAHQFRYRIVPTVLEYFRDDWQKARAVVGFGVHDGSPYELFRQISAEANLIERLPDEHDLADISAYDLDDWWNPHHATWSTDRFEKFLAALAKGT